MRNPPEINGLLHQLYTLNQHCMMLTTQNQNQHHQIQTQQHQIETLRNAIQMLRKQLSTANPTLFSHQNTKKKPPNSPPPKSPKIKTIKPAKVYFIERD